MPETREDLKRKLEQLQLSFENTLNDRVRAIITAHPNSSSLRTEVNDVLNAVHQNASNALSLVMTEDLQKVSTLIARQNSPRIEPSAQTLANTAEATLKSLDLFKNQDIGMAIKPNRANQNQYELSDQQIDQLKNDPQNRLTLQFDLKPRPRNQPEAKPKLTFEPRISSTPRPRGF